MVTDGLEELKQVLQSVYAKGRYCKFARDGYDKPSLVGKIANTILNQSGEITQIHFQYEENNKTKMIILKDPLQIDKNTNICPADLISFD